MGRLTTETRTINAVPYVTSYRYDNFGRLDRITYPGGRQLDYSFDGLGRVSQITTTKGGASETVLSNALYQPFGPTKSFTFGNGQSYSRGFDQDGRIGSYTLGTQSFAVFYDPASRVSMISEINNPPNMNTYSYDNLGRLTNAVLPATTFVYSYDPVGNRLSKIVGTATDIYTPSATNNRLASITPATGPVRNFVFDLNGSTTSDAVNTFGYDTRGRLSQAISFAGTTNYHVNSLGQRIRKMNPQGDTIYHYDSQGRLIAESSPSGQIQTEYIHLGDIPVAVLK
jgi:YD repeat-containing protein